MEMTLESVFSGQGVLGHWAYFLLVVSMLMRRMIWLRILVIVSAIAGIAYYVLVVTDPVSTFWESMLITVNVGQLTLSWWLNRRTQFDARENHLRQLHFATLAPSRLRRLLRRGEWVTLDAGTRLTRAGEPVDALFFLHAGDAKVEVDGIAVGHCDVGGFVGEMTVASGEPAFADVVLNSPATVWRIDGVRLRDLASRDSETGYALEAAFFRMIRKRLAESNSRIRTEADTA